MNKNYSRKQRGGNPVVGLTIGAVVTVAAVAAALAYKTRRTAETEAVEGAKEAAAITLAEAEANASAKVTAFVKTKRILEEAEAALKEANSSKEILTAQKAVSTALVHTRLAAAEARQARQARQAIQARK